MYKNGHLLVVWPDVNIKEQAEFILRPILAFAVALDIKVGEDFTESKISYKMMFDLSDYSKGIVVTLEEKDKGGYSFRAEHP